MSNGLTSIKIGNTEFPIDFSQHNHDDRYTIENVTYSQLKTYRNNGALIPGKKYRITDYVTTTSQPETRSLGHPFDVIVLATSANTLSEEARTARHEGDISIAVSLLDMTFWYKGVLTVDGVEWFEFEDPNLGSLVTSSATPAIGDLVYPYFDGIIYTEEAYPIESVSEAENEYFLNNNANLDAWKIWYCLDNDKARFPWAVAKTKKSIVVQPEVETMLTAEYNGTYEYEGVMYYRWDARFSGMNVIFLTVSDNPKAGDTTSFFGIIEMDIFSPSPMPIVSVNEPSENEGFGVIYRMIDEQNNDIPYDFKNIQFVRKITLGKLDLTNGTDEFVFTFNLFQNFINSDYSFNGSCSYNNMKSLPIGLNNIVFLNEDASAGCYSNTFGNECYSNTFGDSCYSNTFGNECYSNTFGDSCYSNTFGDSCYSNTFGNECYSNTFGDRCNHNTLCTLHNNFGDICYNNTFGNDCFGNTLGNYCRYNTFGDYCESNTLVNGCNYNTFGDRCYTIILGDYCKYNTFGNECYSNTLGGYCNSNTFLSNCYSNSLLEYCESNTLGNDCRENNFEDYCESNSFGDNCYSNRLKDHCKSNSFGDNCYSNIFGNACGSNTFGNYCFDNTFGNECANNTFGNGGISNSFGNYCSGNNFENECYSNTFGNYCKYNSFGDNCVSNTFEDFCEYNTFGNGCKGNSFRLSASNSATKLNYCCNNHFDDGCSYNVIWNSTQPIISNKLQNINVVRGVSGTSDAYNFINVVDKNADYEIKVEKNLNGDIIISSGYSDGGGGLQYAIERTIQVGDGGELTSEQMAYNAETFSMVNNMLPVVIPFMGCVAIPYIDPSKGVVVVPLVMMDLMVMPVYITSNGNIEAGPQKIKDFVFEADPSEQAQFVVAYFSDLRGTSLFSAKEARAYVQHLYNNHYYICTVDVCSKYTSPNEIGVIEYNFGSQRFRRIYSTATGELVKEEEIQLGGEDITVDSALSTTSTNPVQNKIVTNALANKMDKVTLSKVATSGNYNDLSNKPTIPSAVTDSTVSGWGFTKNTGTYSKPSGGIPKSDLASAVQTSLGKADTALQSEQYKGTVTGVKINGTTKNPSSGVVDLGTVITSHQDISGKADINSLATVATSGSYNDLSNKPTIPSAVTESTVSGWGFTKNTGTVTGVKINNSTKSPSNGVVDLGTVITSHQSIKTINNNTITGSGNVSVGTITQVKANGTNVSTSGVANIPAASTSAYGVTKLSSATDSTSTSLAATASAVKAAYDLANSYKGTVTGVKINGTTKNPSSGVVDLGTVSVPTPVVSVSTTSQSIEPNKYYKWSSARSTLTITLATPNDTSILNNYMFEFPTSTSGCTLSVPSGIKWAHGEVPVFEPSMTYQVSIINNLAVVTKFA